MGYSRARKVLAYHIKLLRYRCFSDFMFRDICGAILIYDITSIKSFEELKTYYIPSIINKCPNAVIFLVENKSDSPCRAVEFLEGDFLAQENRMHFYETSIFDSILIKSMFNDMAKEMMKIPSEKFFENSRRNRTKSIFLTNSSEEIIPFTQENVTINIMHKSNCCSK